VSALIGEVNAPHHNSPHVAIEVWCSPHSVEVKMLHPAFGTGEAWHNFDPIAARNLAALLVRASEEAERMAAQKEGDPDEHQG
jgi:hypothetical protein